MRRAFTLIELLVVISVIAVLAAILFPAFVKARERAQMIACANSLKQIGTAVQIYRQDWDDRYPWAQDAIRVQQGKRPALPQVMEAYIHDDSLWICPSDTGETFFDGLTGTGQATRPYFTIIMTSYYYIGIGMPARNGCLAGVFETRIRRPSQAPLLREVRPWHGHYRRDEDMRTSGALYNILYCDGHVGRTSGPVYYAETTSIFQP